MLRRCVVRSNPAKPLRPPHVVLGLSPDATDEKIKERFHELARQYHPDMPGGSTQKFKEVNAAYTMMKVQRAKGLRNDPNEADANGEFDPLAQKMREHMKKYEEDRARGRQKTHAEMMWDDDVYEIVILCGSWLLAMFFIIDRFFSGVDASWRKELLVGAKLQAPPPGMPANASIPEPSWKAVNATEKERGTYLNRQRRSQQKFVDLREFFLIHDTDHVTERKLSVTKISTDLVDESKLAERCPVMRRIDSSRSPYEYDHLSNGMAEEVQMKEWRFVDAGPATALMLEAAKRVEKVNPSEHRLTFFEYHGERDPAPRCMAVVINDRYVPGSGRTQRLITTGKDEFQPRMALMRISDLEAGRLKPSDLILPGWVPLTDKKA